jgi:cytochrome P450
MAVGLKTRLSEVAADTAQQAAIRFFAFRGERVAQLLTPSGLADPYSRYAALREEGAVVRSGRFDAWLVTDYQQVSAIVRDTRWSVDNRLIQEYVPNEDDPFHDHEMLLRMDPPDHTRIRRLVGKAFAPRAVASWRPIVDDISTGLLDDVSGSGFDLIGDYAVPLTVRVICELLGVPHDDWRQFREWGDTATRTLGLNLSRADQRLAQDAFQELAGYLRGLIEARRSTPADDLLSVMIAAEEEGDRLTDRELLANAVLLLLAGFETTVNLIGNGIAALLQNRDQWDKLCADPTLLGNAVEELLRFDSPVQFTGRNAADDVSLGGIEIPKGKQALVLIGSANNDPSVFEDPRRLDITRANARDHVSFSSGAHYCLGASLARLEGEVAFSAFTERFPGLRLAGKPLRKRTDLLRGYERVAVTAI